MSSIGDYEVVGTLHELVQTLVQFSSTNSNQNEFVRVVIHWY